MTEIILTQGQIAAGRFDAADLVLSEHLTVAARVHVMADSAESVQTLVAQWELATAFDAFSAYDAEDTDGLTCAGYMGGVFDGRFTYFTPNRDSNHRESVHGRVLRFDTHGDFCDSGSYAAYDVEAVSQLRTVNYYGAAFDGHFIYFSPQDEGHQYHSRVLRYDTKAEFKNAGSWAVHDLGVIHSHQGIAFDGRFVYFPPGYEGTPGRQEIREDKHSSHVARYDTRGDFNDPASWQSFDSRMISQRATNFDGGAFDGRHIYFVPLSNGVVVRYDTRGDFGDAESWQHYDIDGLKSGGWYVGALFDGRFLYVIAYAHGVIVRYDTHAEFHSRDSWTAYDVNAAGLTPSGFDGGCFDGRYLYFIPWNDSTGRHHCNFLRYDTLGDFQNAESWTSCDAAMTDGIESVGYNGGVFDGRFLYSAPVCNDDEFHGRILRYDTLGEGTFSLRYSDYGHNGGLCAAVPGPSFMINTDQRAFSVSAHRTLGPGRHHIAGVYDGQRVKLFVDGKVEAEQSAAGMLQSCKSAVTIGQLQDGAAAFGGTIEEVYLADSAKDDGWMAGFGLH